MSDTKHPMQPIVLVDGIARFKDNRLVRLLNELLKADKIAESLTTATEQTPE